MTTKTQKKKVIVPTVPEGNLIISDAIKNTVAELIAKAQAIAGGIHCPSNPERVGYGMHTFSGRWYFPLDPRVEEVHIEDIAHGLSNQCRFNGQSRRFLSVAEHCYWASYIGPEDEALERLLHDAAEAYIGDIIRPLKLIPQLRDAYLPIEAANEAVIAQRFGLVYPWPASVKKADEAVVTAEMAQNINNPHKGHLHDSSVEADVKLQFWNPEQAKHLFMRRFHSLATRRGLEVA